MNMVLAASVDILLTTILLLEYAASRSTFSLSFFRFFLHSESLQVISRFTQRNPRFGVVVVRFGCQGNLIRAPFGGISLTARQVGHSKCETPASCAWASDTPITSVKEHPRLFTASELSAFPTGS